jgi:hypothetical protein
MEAAPKVGFLDRATDTRPRKFMKGDDAWVSLAG